MNPVCPVPNMAVLITLQMYQNSTRSIKAPAYFLKIRTVCTVCMHFNYKIANIHHCAGLAQWLLPTTNLSQIRLYVSPSGDRTTGAVQRFCYFHNCMLTSTLQNACYKIKAIYVLYFVTINNNNHCLCAGHSRSSDIFPDLKMPVGLMCKMNSL